jgi:hypothetical protein
VYTRREGQGPRSGIREALAALFHVEQGQTAPAAVAAELI